MNRYTKEAFKLFEEQSENEKISIICSLALQAEKYSFSKPDCRFSHVQKIKQMIKANYQAKTIYGKRKAADANNEHDPYRDVKVWIAGGFTQHDEYSYRAIGSTSLKSAWYASYYESVEHKQLNAKWDAVKASLFSKKFGESSYGDAQLNHERLFDDEQHVYFIADDKNHRVKIGITINIERRLNEIKKKLGNPKLYILSVIWHGGLKLEQHLHEHFRNLRVHGEHLGVEWFSMNDELTQFIVELNRHGIKGPFVTDYLNFDNS